ncbi:oxidoreductase [Lasallia pustulata]|uniref:Oxidoreductase n=1 Tax=Lasallia pustulata TaxID=136370 RepID=A0A1W5DC67_9LECA|nr:oxidoreductase [Lasallia pustulata]
MPPSQSTSVPQSKRGTSLTESFAELLDFRFLIYQSIVHPLDAIETYLPRLSVFWSASKIFTPDQDIPHLQGRVILVTGGNTGLGKESVRQLAQHHPAHIWLAARTPAKAQVAISEINEAVPSAKLTFLPLDLSSFRSIASAARDFTSQSSRLDVLLNNAGIMAVPEGMTEEGYEIQFGTNHLGHALLTKLLLPTLLSTAEKGTDVRIVNLSSEGHKLAPTGGILFDKSELDAQGTWARYGQSKLANILHARELARRYPSVTAVSVHPGIVRTELYKPNQETNLLVRCGTSVMGPFIMRDVKQGALNQLWAVAATKGDVVNGAYYKPVGQLSNGSGYAHDRSLARRLWEWTEKELVAQGY